MASSNEKIVIITGASGLIGTALLSLFRKKKNYRVIGVYNKNNPFISAPHIDCIQGNLTQPHLWQQLKICQNPTLIHCAAKIPKSFEKRAAQESYKENKAIDQCMIDFAQETRARLIYLSSTSVYGSVRHKVLREIDHINPSEQYSKGKIEMENLIIKQKRFPYFILRVSAPYGPHQRFDTVITTFIKRAIAGLPLIYFGTGQRQQDFTYTKDVALACFNCIHSKHYGLYNIASGHAISMKDLASLIKQVVGSNSEIKSSGLRDPQETHQPLFDVLKARRMLRWRPTYTLRRGIKELASFLKEHNS